MSTSLIIVVISRTFCGRNEENKEFKRGKEQKHMIQQSITIMDQR